MSGHEDGTVRLWDLETGGLSLTFSGHAGPVRGVCTTPDGKTAVSAGADGSLRHWDLDSGKCLRTLLGHAGAVNGVCATRDGKRAVSVSDDGTLKVWDLDTGDRKSFKAHEGRVLALGLSSDGLRALTGGMDKVLRFWDIARNAVVQAFEVHACAVRVICLSQDGSLALSAGEDKTLKLWDVKTGRWIRTIGAADAVCFEPQGRFAFSAGEDKTLTVWELETDRGVWTFEGQGGAIKAAAAAPDGRGVVTAGPDGLRAWELDWEYAFAEKKEPPRTADRKPQAETFMQVAVNDVRLMLRAALKIWIQPLTKLFPKQASNEENEDVLTGVLFFGVTGVAVVFVVIFPLLNLLNWTESKNSASGRYAMRNVQAPAAPGLVVQTAPPAPRETGRGGGPIAGGMPVDPARTRPDPEALRKYQEATRRAEEAQRRYEEIKRRNEEARGQEASGSAAGTARTTAGKAGIEWVTVPGGSFIMGSDNGHSDEKPRHRVTVRTFYLARTLVTNKQYKACVDAGVCKASENFGERFSGDDQPVVGMSWYDAKTFCEWVGGRLPSEAEWEYAAKSGGQDWEYPWGNEAATCARAVIDDGGTGCGRNSTWPVCSKPAGNTSQGLCDMAGNASEWVQDRYHSSYDGAPSDWSAWESSAGSPRVLRGGSWRGGAGDARSAYRSVGPGFSAGHIGFRPARVAAPTKGKAAEAAVKEADWRWETDDPAGIRWDARTATLSGVQVNTRGTYAYTKLGGFDPNRPWRVDCDFRINRDDWSAGLTFGLFDRDLRYPNGAGMDAGISDGGNLVGLWTARETPPGIPISWDTGIWYHMTLEYDLRRRVSLMVTDKQSGKLLAEKSVVVSSFPKTMIRLGVSRVHMKNTGAGASGSAAVDFSLTNIHVVY